MRVFAVSALTLVACSLTALTACSKGDGEAQAASTETQQPTMVATADEAALGAQLFKSATCAVCHIAAPPDSPAANRMSVGPNLWGVFGRHSAATGYAYSPAMKSADLVWDEATLDTFLANPLKMVPGTRMSFAGLPDPGKRAAIISYLETLK